MTSPDDPARDLLTLSQWLSPAFPVGGYAFSHGLDHAVSVGDVSDAASFAAWLGAVLRHGAGRSDAILVAHAQSGGDLEALNDLAAALTPCVERWTETLAQGRAFVRTTNALLGTDLPLDCAFPVAVGAQARALSLSTSTVASFFLQAFASNLTSIATRIVPLGQTEAQAVLAGLANDIATLGDLAAEARLDDLTSGVPGADLAAMLHETQEVRLFQS
ncbi:urease accessory protein UreF [Meridianimarinicoccus aquatilis]|uniref:Urease accessory protein UreF n=1 Tax=Meridianimarinicoccus aquatilis TaxID=2552766 RepID=A0A4R6AVK5_9RHOB|nr:urease accessory UreF family protein [Fluviibacterium aquatile]TDL86828.1 urease accessory protein UreF [Fluviibacterium aquatile]